MPRPKRALMVGIEGIDAVGKRTQSSILESKLRAKGIATKVIAFPDYSTGLGEEIRRFLKGGRHYPPEVRHLLFAANRWEKKDALYESLSSADVILVNRYSESNFAYGVASGLSIDWLVALEAGLPKTDLVTVLDASPSALFSRRGPTKDRFEMNLGFQEKAREAYLELAGRFGWKVIDASRGIEETNIALESAVLSIFSKGRTV